MVLESFPGETEHHPATLQMIRPMTDAGAHSAGELGFSPVMGKWHQLQAGERVLVPKSPSWLHAVPEHSKLKYYLFL